MFIMDSQTTTNVKRVSKMKCIMLITRGIIMNNYLLIVIKKSFHHAALN